MRNVLRDDFGDELFELLHQLTEEVCGSPSSCVAVGTLQISPDVFNGLIFEELNVRLAQRQVWQNNLFNDLAKDGLVIEAFGVLSNVGDGGQELQSLADKDVVLGFGSDGGEQVPRALDKLAQKGTESILVLLNVEHQCLKNASFYVFKRPRLGVVVGMEDIVVVGEVFDQETADGVEVVFEDRRQILTREIVKELDGKIEGGEMGLDEFLVALI